MSALRENDHIILIGDPAGKAEYSHEGREGSWYRFPISVERLSGTRDELNVLAKAEDILAIEEMPDSRLRIEGEVRSFNNRSGVGARLVISVLARKMERTTETYRNELELSGVIVKPPVYRKTPMGREITDLLIASQRRYGKSDYLPVIVWGYAALEAADYRVGDEIKIRGRLQSRKYLKTIGETTEEKTAYEISAGEIEKI